MFDIIVAATTKCDEIIQSIGLKIITFIFFVWNDVMYINSRLPAAFSAAYLACVTISLKGVSALLVPVWASVRKSSAADVGRVVFFDLIFRNPRASALDRAKATTSTIFRHALVDDILLAALFTVDRHKVFRPSRRWLGLASSVFRPALIGTKTRLTVSPFDERLIAPLADKCRFFVGLGFELLPAGAAATHLTLKTIFWKVVPKFGAAYRANLELHEVFSYRPYLQGCGQAVGLAVRAVHEAALVHNAIIPSNIREVSI